MHRSLCTQNEFFVFRNGFLPVQLKVEYMNFKYITSPNACKLWLLIEAFHCGYPVILNSFRTSFMLSEILTHEVITPLISNGNLLSYMLFFLFAGSIMYMLVHILRTWNPFSYLWAYIMFLMFADASILETRCFEDTSEFLGIKMKRLKT